MSVAACPHYLLTYLLTYWNGLGAAKSLRAKTRQSPLRNPTNYYTRANSDPGPHAAAPSSAPPQTSAPSRARPGPATTADVAAAAAGLLQLPLLALRS